jgi:hypothetical protein
LGLQGDTRLTQFSLRGEKNLVSLFQLGLGAEIRHFECLLNGELGNPDIDAGPEKSKLGAGLVQVCGIECKPKHTSPDNVAQKPLGVNETTD